MNSKSQVYLRGVGYSLGNIKLKYDDVESYRRVISESKLPEIPELWGWGNSFVSSNIFDDMRSSIGEAISKADIDPSEIELVCVASSLFPINSIDLYSNVGDSLSANNITSSNIIGVSLSGCATALSSVDMLRSHMIVKGYKNALLVVMEKIPEESDRFTNFCVFSDCVLSAVVSSEKGIAEVLACSTESMVSDIGGGIRYDDDSKKMIELMLSNLFKNVDETLDDVKTIFSNNIFLPVKKYRELGLGFKGKQMYLENVREKGHCLSCDSLLNFADAHERGEMGGREIYLLQSEANGFCSSSLIRYLG